MVRLPTHICVTRPQCFNTLRRQPTWIWQRIKQRQVAECGTEAPKRICWYSNSSGIFSKSGDWSAFCPHHFDTFWSPWASRYSDIRFINKVTIMLGPGKRKKSLENLFIAIISQCCTFWWIDCRSWTADKATSVSIAGKFQPFITHIPPGQNGWHFAMTRVKADPVQWRIYAALGGDKLTSQRWSSSINVAQFYLCLSTPRFTKS